MAVGLGSIASALQVRRSNGRYLRHNHRGLNGADAPT